jgi:ribonuclease III
MPADELQRALAWAAATLEHQPANEALFHAALTHRSAGSGNNERLEFLGDAVLNLLVAEHLYRQFPEADEGALSRLRAAIVSGESLARVAAETRIGDVLFLGAGELKTGGFRRDSILADAFEALCGALYLDAGIDTTRRVMLRLLAPALDALELPAELRDAKTRLQEWLQGRGLALPRYTVESISGEPHAQHFRVSCEVSSLSAITSGEGSSRRRAEQVAAQKLLDQVLP